MWEEKIEEIRAISAKYQEKLNDGCSEELISDFEDEIYESFNYKVPKEYLLFLNYVNGVNFNGLIIYGVDDYIIEAENDVNEDTGYIESNELWYENEGQKKYMFFGHSGITWYCYDIEKKIYLELDKPSGSKGLECNSLDKLIDKALFDALPSESKVKFR